MKWYYKIFFYYLAIQGWLLWAIVIWTAFLFGVEGQEVFLFFNLSGEMILDFFLIHLVLLFIIIIIIGDIKSSERRDNQNNS